MSKRPFHKPSLPVQDQIALLQQRGIDISDGDLAARYLQFIGYYRLSGYTHYFKTKGEKYLKGTTFEAVIDHYLFDRRLRILLFDAIERIEVALRTVMTSVLTEKHGPFWFTKDALFVTRIDSKPVKGRDIVLQAIRDATVDQKNKDVFLRHYYETYSSPELPPSWVVMETLSMGAVSKILSLLKAEERKDIANPFKTKERHLVSWMRSLNYTRNLCAHHARVWNRVFTIKVEADKKYPQCRDDLFFKGRFYSQAVVIAILLDAVAPDHPWEDQLKGLFSSFSHSYASDMGFPNDWDGFKLNS